jgi:hypothetical protein
MAYFIFNVLDGDVAQVKTTLHGRLWPVGAREPRRDVLGSGDQVLVYLGAPERLFLGRAEVVSTVHEWSPAEMQAAPVGSSAGVSLALVEVWEPPVPMSKVLSAIDRSAGAGADFENGVVQITEVEYETALAVANR